MLINVVLSPMILIVEKFYNLNEVKEYNYTSSLKSAKILIIVFLLNYKYKFC